MRRGDERCVPAALLPVARPGVGPLAGEDEWPSIRDAVPAILERMRDAGRTIERLPLTVFTGTVPSASAVADMKKNGVDRIVVDVSAADRAAYLSELDELQRACA